MAITKTSDHAAEFLLMALADSSKFGTFLRGVCDMQPRVGLSQYGTFRQQEAELDAAHADSPKHRI